MAPRPARALVLALLAPAVPLLATAAPAAPAHADDPRPVLRWELSQFFDDHLATHVLADGATEDASGVVTFPDGVGTYDRATGAGSIAYQGSVAGSFAFGGATQYTVTVSDPVVAVDDAGHGTVTVVVESVIPPGSTADEAATAPQRVLATTFDAGRWVGGEGDLGTQTATPHFAGVLPAGSARATELGIPAGQPVDGKAWAPDFLANLVPDVRALFYASGSGSDPKKAPATIVAQGTGTGTATEPEPDAVDGLQWEVSAAFDATMETHTLAGVTEDDLGVVTFPRASGTYDTATGEASVAYTGSVTAQDTAPLLPNPGLPFPLPGSGQTYEVATVTVADPVVTTDLDGNGTVTAVVSSSNPTGPSGVAASRPPARVEVVRFAAGVDPWVDGAARGRLVRTPPVFSTALLDQLVEPARASFGTTPSAASDALPSTITAAAPPAAVLVPDVAVSTTSATPDGGLVLRVDGTGFRGTTRSGDTGIRVGLAPRGDRPDVTTAAGLARFAAYVDVPAASITDHAFTTELAVPTSALDPGTAYAVFTWQAPSRSNPSQDAVEPVDVDFVALGLAEALVPRVSVSQVEATATSITWSVAGTGFTAVTRSGDKGVYVGLAEAGGLPDVSTFDTSKFVAAAWVRPEQVVDHAFTVRLSADRGALDPARRYSFYTWQAHTHSNTSQDTETPVEVVRRTAELGSSSAHTTTFGRGGRFAVTVSDGATGTVTMRGLGAAQRVAVSDGSATFRVPRTQRVGRYRPTFTYSGDDVFAARTVATSYSVRRASPVVRVVRRTATRLVVRVVGPGGVARPSGRVVVDGRTTRLRSGRALVPVPARDRRFVVRYRGSSFYRPVRVVVTRPVR